MNEIDFGSNVSANLSLTDFETKQFNLDLSKIKGMGVLKFGEPLQSIVMISYALSPCKSCSLKRNTWNLVKLTTREW